METCCICILIHDLNRMLLRKNREGNTLTVTWACARFSTYITCMRITTETDHKLPIAILGTKNIDSLLPRVLLFWLRLARYDNRICHIPGKLLYTAVILSYVPLFVNNDSKPQLGELKVSWKLACPSYQLARAGWISIATHKQFT